MVIAGNIILMIADRYDFYVNETFLDFDFVSIGPKGKIKKIVRYTLQNANGITYVNLGFGDLIEKTGEIDDLTISDNKDSAKILATIAATVIVFCEHFPDMLIYFKGSTPVRTRFYQIGISLNWRDVKPLFIVYGFTNGNWYKFQRNINYESFMIIRRIL